MNEFWGTVVGVSGALAALFAVFWPVLKSRGDNKSAAENRKTAIGEKLDARLEAELKKNWERLDAQDEKIRGQDAKIELQDDAIRLLETRETRRTGAITRILRSIAKQWPRESQGPDLDPADLAEIEETIPSEWMRNPRPT